MSGSITTAIFDLGNVLIDWDPRYLYRRLFKNNEDEMNKFLSEICTMEWNSKQDCGRTYVEAEEELKYRYPDKAELIAAWKTNYNEMMKGPIDGSVALLSCLRDQGVPLYALTNWSAETFPCARKRFAFLDWFRGIVVSGTEKVAKPDPRIFHIMCDRYHLDPRKTVFIDDRPENTEAATALGFATILFTDPPTLQRALEKMGLMQRATRQTELEIV